MSVTPGSDTLWSVHSGPFCWTRRLASSTRSWKRRSSRLGTGRAIGCLLDSVAAGDHVEREHEVPPVVGRLDHVADIDVERGHVDAVDGDDHVVDLDPGLPAPQRLLDLARDRVGRGAVRRPEDVLVD